MADQQRVYHTGGLGPPELLAEAKGNENERWLMDRIRTGPMARRIYEGVGALNVGEMPKIY